MDEFLELFITQLNSAHIWIEDEEDELVWIFNPNSRHQSSRLGYIPLLEVDQNDIAWQYKKLWKISASLKSILLFWLILKNWILTRDKMWKRGFLGPGICVSCHDAAEDSCYLFVQCGSLDRYRNRWRYISNSQVFGISEMLKIVSIHTLLTQR